MFSFPRVVSFWIFLAPLVTQTAFRRKRGGGGGARRGGGAGGEAEEMGGGERKRVSEARAVGPFE